MFPARVALTRFEPVFTVRHALVVSRHSRADVPSCNSQSLHPHLIQHLITARDDKIDRDVFGARHMPHEPHQGIRLFCQ